jgi:hypothetical protein
VYPATPRRVRFSLVQHFSGDRGDFAVADEQEAQEIVDRVASVQVK